MITFDQDSKNGYESEVKSLRLYMYACAFTAERFEAIVVDWQEGWCNDARKSVNRFRKDVGKPVNSYVYGPLDNERIEKHRAALTRQDQVLVRAFSRHLGIELGDFDWAVWRTTAMATKQGSSPAILLVEPVKMNAGGYLLPTAIHIAPTKSGQ